MFKTFIIAAHERALLIQDGRLIDLLEPGRHRRFDLENRLKAEIFDVRLPALNGDWGRLIEMGLPDIAAREIVAVRTDVDELGLVSFDGQPATVVAPGKTAYFWTSLRAVTHATVRIDGAGRLEKRMIDAWASAAGHAIAHAVVSEHEAGLLFIDGELVERLKPGRHAFWAFGRKVEVKSLDLRPQTIEVAAQEILTKDRVSLRLTLTAFATIVDPERLVRSTPDHAAHVYKLVQFAAREAVGGRTLDEVLNQRAEVDAEVAGQVRERLGDIGLAIGELRVKDVILPGDMRELLNKVVEAEKAAQANLIRRREETAATRSLLNTARMMEDNPTLMRLKELEALEKVTEKIGRIDLHAGEGAGLDAVLNNIVRLATPKKGERTEG